MNVMNNHHGYTWTNLKQQREFGRKVAFKLLDSPDNGDFSRSNLRDLKKNSFGISSRDMRVPCVLPLEAPILGSLLQDFLLAYGTVCSSAKCSLIPFRNNLFANELSAKRDLITFNYCCCCR